ncbi:hypothetical protein REJC140_03803 [Pseudorhizobium endolithicum]|uniref:Uncharacterized protein n=1 Tax=Pseudorhizobium endolithicum TaxID=1191678 RepID=A0ABN7JRD9_9HYPH|nr:hypothetical protein [Pseudorhizobium endolithicum]CAD7044302.1 hypothetical protein REJC140_03803 [Pseudorhizobium endolithicum]
MSKVDTHGRLLLPMPNRTPQEGWGYVTSETGDPEAIFATQVDARAWAGLLNDPGSKIIRVIIRGDYIQEVQPPD